MPTYSQFSPPLKAVAIGAGYFSQYHFEAWQRIPQVRLTALCEVDEAKGRAACRQYGIPRWYSQAADMLQREQPDFVDIITPPATHLQLCRLAAGAGVAIICQKPLAPDQQSVQQIASCIQRAAVPFMVHENFRFQPWYREIKRLLAQNALGQLHSLNFRLRTGDGWQPDAYLDRQPYFRTMPRLLIFETGVHFIDTFRFLAGEISRVYARLRTLNPAIAGEDWAWLMMEFESGAMGFWDADRYHQSLHPNPRYTFGSLLLEGSKGSLRLYEDGNIGIQLLGQTEQLHPYTPPKTGFAGDCVYATQLHFVQQLLQGRPFETALPDYLKTLAVQEAAYRSHQTNMPVTLKDNTQMSIDG